MVPENWYSVTASQIRVAVRPLWCLGYLTRESGWILLVKLQSGRITSGIAGCVPFTAFPVPRYYSCHTTLRLTILQPLELLRAIGIISPMCASSLIGLLETRGLILKML